MALIVNLDVVLAQRKMRLNELAEKIGITPQNLSVLKTGRARAIRFSTLEAICQALHCQPGDLFAYEDDARQSAPAPAPQPTSGLSTPQGAEV